MKYRKFEFPAYNTYTVKVDKFKSCHIEIVFRNEVEKNELLDQMFLSDILSCCSKKYPRRKDVLAREEELYKTRFMGTTTRVGNTSFTSFILDFINPEYALEKNYLKDVIEFLFEMLQNPFVEDDEFDKRIFNIIKKSYENSILSIKENPNSLAINHSLCNMDKDSPSTYGMIAAADHLADITPSSLYKTYKKLFKHGLCDIFITGNLDMDKVVKMIEKEFKNRTIKTHDVDLLIENKTRKKALIVDEKSSFVQSNLIVIYNLVNLTKRQRDIVFPIFNHIFGTGSLNSKLYKVVREENSLCYNISSMYLKYDSLLMIKTSLAKENIKKTTELIKKCLKDMQEAKFSDDELEDAKTSMLFGTKVSFDNIGSITDNYAFSVYDGIALLDERPKLIKSVTKEEVIDLAKQLKINTIYILSEGDKACKK